MGIKICDTCWFTRNESVNCIKCPHYERGDIELTMDDALNDELGRESRTLARIINRTGHAMTHKLY